MALGALLSGAASSRQTQLATTAVVSAAVAAAAILSYQRLAQDRRVARLKRSIPPDGEEASSFDTPTAAPALASARADPDAEADADEARSEALARRALAGDYNEALILEQLARNRVFLTEPGLDRLRAAFVVVVGCGGVGSHAAAALARAGVGALRLVDFDQVSLSSLNRHAVATLQDVGSPKVAVLRRRLRAVTPWVRFDLCGEKLDAASAPRLLGALAGRPADFVVDAIDNIDTKVELLRYCHDHGTPVISCMGAGAKSDPTRVAVADISASTYDRLSRATRRRLKLLGIPAGIPAVFSVEAAAEGKAALLPLPDADFARGKEAIRELGVMPDFRVRILPVLGTMPAVFGYTAANHVILGITGYPLDYNPAKGRDKMYDQVHATVQSVEEKIVRARHGSPDAAVGLKVPLTLGDIAFLVEEVYRGRSAITGLASRLVLIRWKAPDHDTLLRIAGPPGGEEQRSAVLRLSDLVCMTREEAALHQRTVLLGGQTVDQAYDAAVVERVQSRLDEASAYEKYR